MLKTGVLIECENNSVKETSLGILTATAGSEIYAIVVDADAYNVRDQLGEFGAKTIIDVEGSFYKNPDWLAETLAAITKEYRLDALIGTASIVGKDIFARLAAAIGEPLVSDALEVNVEEKSAKKSHFSGKTIATLKVNSSLFLCTVRPNAIEPIPSPVESVLVKFTHNAQEHEGLKVLEVKGSSSEKMDLTEAPVIITGGRAIKSAENFKMLEECAAKLGAAVGASRAAVDAGYAPHSMQVGQTGKTVSPKLYIACGVSGAVQHFAGMKTSKVIVAINEDKDAPIFSRCDYGIVGDIFNVVPALSAALK